MAELKLVLDAKPALDALKLAQALADLVGFIDGLTYSQLDHVPGLFTAAREARKALPKT